MANKVTKQQVWKVSKIALNVFFYIVIVFILMFAIANMKVKTTGDVPNIFGRGFLSVQSDSMNGSEEDSFDKGDLIFVRMLNDKRKDNLKVGDTITFYGKFGEAPTVLNTHRIVAILTNTNGEKVFVTQGDKVADMPGRKFGEGGVDGTDFESVGFDEAIAVYTGSWKGAGKALDYLQSPTGFGLFIVLPAVLILIFEAFFLIRNVLVVNKEKMQKEFQDKDEAMRREIMEQLRKEQEEKEKE